MTTHTSKLKSLCKLALAASMLLGAAQWASAADKTPVADTKPSVQKGKSGTIPVEPPSAAKGIKDQGVKGCGNCGVTGKVAVTVTGAEPPVAAKGAKTQ